MSNLCPYCLKRSRDSDDHVFPEFLGGTRKVRTCTECNNRFGHRFEGPVSNDLAPVIVFLSFSGYKHKRLVVHKHAHVDETTGIEYDLDSERQSYPSKPHLLREEGKVKRIVARTAREAREIVASLKAKGRVKQVVRWNREVREGLRPPLRDVRIKVGTAMRQLAVKMCVAVGQLLVPDIVLLDERCREFLLKEVPESSQVRWSQARFPSLDALRPALAHVVYIEGDSSSGKCFGVLQLFGGAFQLYAPLSSAYTSRDFAALGILDVTTFREQFQEIEPLQLPEAPQFTGVDQVERFLADWGRDFNNQTQAAFGQSGVDFGMSPKQSIAGVRLTFPLLWVEHEVGINLAMALIPDHQPERDLALPSDPRQWILSSDFGATRLAVFDTFAQKWNLKALNRALSQEHVYVPDEIVPGIRILLSEDCWCPVESMTISYRVHKQAWLGSVNLTECPSELDRSQHTLKPNIKLTNDDIPVSRDPSWPVIADPDGYLKAAENILVVERWDIDASSFHFTEFGINTDA